MRHAKARTGEPGGSDRERRLTEKGRAAAARLGVFLRATGVRPDLVLCSTAARTVETLEFLDLDASVEVLLEDEIYHAGALDLFARLRRLPSSVGSVLLVGHLPTIQELAIAVTDGDEHLDRYPPAALADLRLPIVEWTELVPGVGHLAAFTTPHDLD